MHFPTLRALLLDQWTSFLPLSYPTTQFALETSIPPVLQDILDRVISLDGSPLPRTVLLDYLEPASLVALAGLFLEYPVAYLPIAPRIRDAEQISRQDLDFGKLLGGTEVQVFTCEIRAGAETYVHHDIQVISIQS